MVRHSLMPRVRGAWPRGEIMILALDLGTKTGWALKNTTGKICSGAQSFKPGRFEGGGMRFLRFQKWLDDITSGITEIYFEEVRRHLGTDAAHIYGGLMAVLTSYCEEYEIPYRGIPVGTWKKFVCGKGNADKQMVMDAVKSMGFSPKGFDEADAIGILHCACGEVYTTSKNLSRIKSK